MRVPDFIHSVTLCYLHTHFSYMTCAYCFYQFFQVVDLTVSSSPSCVVTKLIHFFKHCSKWLSSLHQQGILLVAVWVKNDTSHGEISKHFYFLLHELGRQFYTRKVPEQLDKQLFWLEEHFSRSTILQHKNKQCLTILFVLCFCILYDFYSV